MGKHALKVEVKPGHIFFYREPEMFKGIILWLLGVPFGIVILLWLVGVLR